MATKIMPIVPNAKRNIVYQVLDGERDYQEQKFPGVQTLEHTAALIDEYAVKLAHLFAPSPSPAHAESPNDNEALEIIREIGALAVRAMDTHGVVPRVGHVPGSLGVTGTMHLIDKGDKTAVAAAPPHQVLPPEHPANAGHAPAAEPAQHTEQPHTSEHKA